MSNLNLCQETTLPNILEHITKCLLSALKSTMQYQYVVYPDVVRKLVSDNEQPSLALQTVCCIIFYPPFM